MKKVAPLQIVMIGVNLILGAVFGVWTGKSAAKFGPEIFLVLILAAFLAIALHESGHYLAGRSVGARCILFVVGPLRWERDEAERFRLRWSVDFGFGGLCAMIPPNDGDYVRRFRTIIAGGPIMSFVVAAIFLAAGQLIPSLPPFVAFSLTIIGGLSGFFVVITALPMSTGAFLTDGARWLRLGESGPLARRDAALLHLVALSASGVPSSKWPETLLTDALAVEDESSFAAYTHWCAYTAAAEREDYESARDHIVRGEEIIRKFNRTLAFPYIIERHWLGAWKFGDIDAAQSALQDLGKDPVGIPKSTLLRLQAAISQTDRPALIEQALAKVPAAARGNWERTMLQRMLAPNDAA